MKTLKQIFETLENNDIKIDEYKENGILCGYELNTYTKRGVNMIVFLDFREHKNNGDPTNAEDFLTEFNQYLEDFEIDEEIDLHREMKDYENNFTIRESLEDFEDWHKNLTNLLN